MTPNHRAQALPGGKAGQTLCEGRVPLKSLKKGPPVKKSIALSGGAVATVQITVHDVTAEEAGGADMMGYLWKMHGGGPWRFRGARAWLRVP